jgi:hypothetical protein
MTRLWINRPETPEGKFLVVRRDGTIPAWPHFVMGARDPAAPAALEAYAAEAERLGFDPEYVGDVRQLADDFRAHRGAHGSGDPEAPPHRTDDPRVIRLMREGGHIFDGMATIQQSWER